MCGIVGYVATRSTVDEDTVRSMADALVHRGPDDAGVWIDRDAGIALGHRRLSVVDLSPGGHQPMYSADGRLVVVFNGEIYNFRELRKELEASAESPIAWRGHSDTEVLLEAASRWGVERALPRFVGMFAFALWDRSRRTLVLARDRLGEKPLYYGWQGDAFLFGSELKALRRHPRWRADVDRNAVASFARFSYVPAPYSIYRGIFKLPPGAWLEIDCRGDASAADLRPRRYWSLADVVRTSNRIRADIDPEAAVDEFERLFGSAVAGQMIADVPLGAFLSGGVDSSAVVAVMQAHSPRPVRTFTIGFSEEAFNEAHHARAVAAHLGTEHTELYVTPEDALAVIPELPRVYDEPFSDSSQIPTLLLSRLTRRSVTVSLSGDGGDELFGGYNRYTWCNQIWRRVGVLPVPLRRALARSMTTPGPAAWDRLAALVRPLLPASLRHASVGDKVHKLAGMLAQSGPQGVYRALVSHWNGAALVPGATELPTPIDGAEGAPPIGDLTAWMMFVDTLTYLPDDILVKVDRASMAASLESRVPLLDHRIVEFAWSLPDSLKVRHGTGKWILRQLLYRHVPKELIERPKMGFGVPIDSWLRGPLRGWAEDLLDETRLAREGWFDAAEVRRKWTEHLSGRRNWQYHLWDILMFQAWFGAQ